MKDPEPSETPRSARALSDALRARLAAGTRLLGPLTITRSGNRDTRIFVTWGRDWKSSFAVKFNALSTPRALRAGMDEARRAAAVTGGQPLVTTPYLSPRALNELEAAGVSGVDLCGNGLIIIPGKTYIRLSGKPNHYPQSQPLANPYSGRSAMVARMLFAQPVWPALDALRAAIQERGCPISLPQTSKAVRALVDDLVVTKSGRAIRQVSPLSILDRLGEAWRGVARPSKTIRWRLPEGQNALDALRRWPDPDWAITGASSAPRYAAMAQGGPRQVAVRDLARAIARLDGTPETIAGFADFEFVETQQDGYYFMTEKDVDGVRWASKLQAWLEMSIGDARQRQVAQDIYPQIAREAAEQ